MAEQQARGPSDADILKLDNQLCFGLYAATHAITRAYRPLLSELGVTYSQFLVLLALWEQDPQTVSELGDRLFLDSGTLSPVLKRLESAGLVHKQRSPRDERVVQVTLTERGVALRPPVREVCWKVRQKLGMSVDQIAKMRVELDAVIETFKDDLRDTAAA